MLDATSSGEKAPSPEPRQRDGGAEGPAGGRDATSIDVARAGAAHPRRDGGASALTRDAESRANPAPESVTGALKGWPAAGDCAVDDAAALQPHRQLRAVGLDGERTCDEIPVPGSPFRTPNRTPSSGACAELVRRSQTSSGDPSGWAIQRGS